MQSCQQVTRHDLNSVQCEDYTPTTAPAVGDATSNELEKLHFALRSTGVNGKTGMVFLHLLVLFCSQSE